MIEIEFILVLILIILFVIASRLWKILQALKETAARAKQSEDHLRRMRDVLTRSNVELVEDQPLRLTPEDLR